MDVFPFAQGSQLVRPILLDHFPKVLCGLIEEYYQWIDLHVEVWPSIYKCTFCIRRNVDAILVVGGTRAEEMKQENFPCLECLAKEIGSISVFIDEGEGHKEGCDVCGGESRRNCWLDVCFFDQRLCILCVCEMHKFILASQRSELALFLSAS